MAISKIVTNSVDSGVTLTSPVVATTIGVGGTTPSASGSGISFPATQSASTDVNTLDDYEEGTWTPNIAGNATYTTQSGVYTKVGRAVSISFILEINTIGTGNNAYVSAMPFSATNSGASLTVGYFASIATGVVYVSGYLSGTNIQLTGLTAAATTTGNPAIFGNGANIRGSATYSI